VGGNNSNDCSISWSGYLTPLVTTALETPIDARPEGLSVVPNPTGSFASIRFHLKTSQEVLLAIYDVTGRKVRTIYDGRIGEGDHAMNWDGRDDRNRPVADGAYFARLESSSFAASKKIIQAP
jgi:flagellar hook assembly protein FlgD